MHPLFLLGSLSDVVSEANSGNVSLAAKSQNNSQDWGQTSWYL